MYKANAAIEGLNKANNLTEIVKNQLIGEAKFIRAFCNFYLVNLYGDVPLCTSTDYKINAKLTRASTSNVYSQIISDLKEAQDLMADKYLKSDAVTSYSPDSEERVRPNKWVATALLARAYLYNNDWVNAEIESSRIINNAGLYDLEPLNNVFKKNNKEAIWQLQAVGSGARSNTGEGIRFILPSTGPSSSYPLVLQDGFVSSFEANDERKTAWIGSVMPQPGTTYNYPFKYKIGAEDASSQEYCTVFRLSEIYLIRAEARAHMNKVTDSQLDVNVIRARAQLSNTTVNDQASLLVAILNERKVELFTEWGHRWFDLKRTNNIEAVMSNTTPSKGGSWETTDQLYPIPQDELLKAQQLVQNPGY